MIHRRDALHIGTLTALGISAADIFRGRASAGQDVLPVRARSCILLWLDGGPSHLETFDLKPEAPSEVRGPFAAIDTNVSGIQISEHLPQTAQICDKLAIIRSLTSPLGEHGLANHYLMTGYKPSPVLQYPSLGSVVSYLRGRRSILPRYIAIPDVRSGGSGFLGGEFEPFVTGGDPSRADFRVQDLDMFPGLTDLRLNRRREYLAAFDAAQAHFEGRQDATDAGFEQALRLVSSPKARTAFSLEEESPETRARYGSTMLGQSCLLARRLIERGVPFVSVLNTGWDTHENLTLQLRDGYSGAKKGVGLIPTFDHAFAALTGELTERGLLSETLVIAMGEFGRTPKLNTRAGRDHWPRVFSAVLAGAGIPGGQVIGSSDATGESPVDNPVTPGDLARTLYTILGVDPDLELKTADGRPVRVNVGGRVVQELIGKSGTCG